MHIFGVKCILIVMKINISVSKLFINWYKRELGDLTK
jgi:hypothetical protein